MATLIGKRNTTNAYTLCMATNTPSLMMPPNTSNEGHPKKRNTIIILTLFAFLAVATAISIQFFSVIKTETGKLTDQAFYNIQNNAQTREHYRNVFGSDTYPNKFDAYHAPYTVPNTLKNNNDLPVVVAAPLTRGYTLTIIQNGTPVTKPGTATANECVTALQDADPASAWPTACQYANQNGDTVLLSATEGRYVIGH